MSGPGTREAEGGGWRIAIILPGVWLGLFILAPVAILLKIALSTPADHIPPYAPLMTLSGDGTLRLALHLENFGYVFHQPLYAAAALHAFEAALATTLGCLLLGYPMAYAIVRSRPRARRVLLVAVVAPLWTSFLIRVYAWMSVLNDGGLLERLLHGVGILRGALGLMNSQTAVQIVMIYAYLPFMLLPLYATLERLDIAAIEAAIDLGALPIVAFATVTLPMSVPGVTAGCLLVFMPALGEYLIPQLVGSPGRQMISASLFDEFFLNRDWPTAAALALILVLALLAPLLLLQRARARVERRAP